MFNLCLDIHHIVLGLSSPVVVHVVLLFYFSNLFEKQMLPKRNSRTITTRFYTLLPRETAFNCLYPRKITFTMVPPTKYLPGPTLLDQNEPLDSDSDSVTSTIPTNSHLKRSTTDPVRPSITNDGYQLVSSSKTQPKLTANTLAPPHPLRYPNVVISRDPPGHYIENNDPPLQPLVRISVQQPHQYVPAWHALADAEAHPEHNETRIVEPTTPPVPVSTQKWIEVSNTRPTENYNEYQDYDEDNGCPYDDNYDVDFIPVPRDMFQLNPSTSPPFNPRRKCL